MDNPYIEKLNKRGSVLGLDNIKSLLKRLGNPQELVPIIHVAGTNGKGSTIAFMEGILRQAGLHVGKYTSPAVSSYFERFQIDGENISEQDFLLLLAKVKSAADAMEAEEKLFATAFEVETAVAFLYCARTDIILLETGMGGRLDSTNVVKKPLVTVLTSISMDHMQFLGDRLEQIAMEKAGILRKGVACVSSPANIPVEQVIKAQCQKVFAEYVMPEGYELLQSDICHTVFEYGGEEYVIYLPGLFQVENCVTAIAAVSEAARAWNTRLPGEGSNRIKAAIDRLSDSEYIKKGVKTALWPARMEHAASKPDIYIDGAHNIDACVKLSESVKKYFSDKTLIYIVGVLKDKEYKKMMSVMAPMAASIYTVTPENARALDGNILAQVCSLYCDSVHACESLGQALSRAKQEALRFEKPLILAFGSLSYMGELKKCIQED